MLVDISNFALVQFIQVLAVIFFVCISISVVSVRLRLPKNRFGSLIDILMCVIILIYAVTLKINLST
jgi:arginine exporter protein ArgO